MTSLPKRSSLERAKITDVDDVETNEDSDIPLSMSTSTLLHPSNLPTSTAEALQEIKKTLDTPQEKIVVRFQALPGAPALPTKNPVVKVGKNQNFGSVVAWLRKRLGVKGENGLFVYVNKVFAPGLDEGVGGLWRCFKIEDELKVSYSLAPAFG